MKTITGYAILALIACSVCKWAITIAAWLSQGD